MDVKITLSLGRSDLIVSESTSVTISVTNSSNAPLSVPDIETDGHNPKIRVVDLSSKHELVLGSSDREEQASHEFVPDSPPTLVQLAPGQQRNRRGDLLPWVGTLAPGQYEISASLAYNGIRSASEPVKVSVIPLGLVSASTVGSHSGYSPIRYTVWSSRTPKGTVAILTCFTFDEQAQPRMTQSFRFAEPDYPAEPVGSVTPNKQPYPAQWIVWPQDSALAGIYVKQGKIGVPLEMHQLGGVGAVKVIAPVLLDLTGNNGSTPGRGIVSLWRGGPANSELIFRTLEPNGSISTGSSITLPAGQLVWGRAIALSNGERRVYLALQRNGGTDLDIVREKDRSPVQAAYFLGHLIGAGLTLNPQDIVYGAAVMRTGRGLSVHTWQADANGTVHSGTSPAVIADGNVTPDQAIVAVSPTGDTCILLRTANNRWFRTDARGGLYPLAVSLERFGEPVDSFWLNPVTPLVLMASPQTGLTYQRVK